MKIFKRNVWLLLTNFFMIWFVISLVAGPIANQYQSTINSLLDIDIYEKINVDDSNSVYFNSDYLKEDGSYHDINMRNNSLKVSENVGSDGIVLLENKNNALPLSSNSRISLFGIASVNYKFSGGGSGEIKSNPDKSLKTELEESTANGGPGFKVNGTLLNAYDSLKGTYGSSNAQGSATNDPKYNGTNGYTDERYREFYVNEPSWDTVNNKVTNGIEQTLTGSKNTKGYDDAAIMIISRDGSEDGDTWFNSSECFDNSYLDLSTQEAEILTKLCQYRSQGIVKKVILILNTASIMQMKHIAQYDLDAIMLAGCGGVTSFKAIANILSGKVNPSGRLVDTIPYDIKSMPSTTNFGDFRFETSSGLPGPTTIGVYNDFYVAYQEGIYVGYRYYETRYEDAMLNLGGATSNVGSTNGAWNYDNEVAYPFGYGLSYTTFEASNLTITHNDGDYLGSYELSFDIQNTGERPGKTPVGIYLQKPYTDYDKVNHIEKSSVELVGFTKTNILNPGEKKNFKINIDGDELKTFDTYNKKTYILEKGDYYFSLGFDSHDAVNHILAHKGVGLSGDASLAKKVSFANDNFEIFAKSSHTDSPIEAQLQDADLNLYGGTTDQTITYLSRSDYASTYPSTPVKLSCNNEIMSYDMQYGHGEIESVGSYPSFEKVTSPVGELNLAMIMDKEFDDPLWEHLLNQMSFKEMNRMTSGGYLNIYGATSINAPGGAAADGTSGVRRNNPTTATLMGFPTQTVMAQTWDIALIEELGKAFGHECLHTNCVQLYAPGANLHRNPYGGRNWEYYSEDAFISGAMLASEVKGIQSKGVIVCAKHFAFNDQEINRCGVTTWLNEQTAREIYLKVFEMGVCDGEVASLMSSFPRLGCRWVGNYKGLFTNILRDEWGFKGFVETDSAFDQPYMTTSQARAEGIIAGVDFWMDGAPSLHFGSYINNATVVNALRESVHRMLYTISRSSMMNGINSSTIIIEKTPYWKNAIVAFQVAFGVLFASSLGMSIASIIINHKKRKGI